MRRSHTAGLLVAGASLVAGCAALQQLAALRNVQFDLGPVSDGRLAGVSLARVRDFSDLSVADAARITLAVGRRELPLEFTVALRAENPAENGVSARMLRFAWSLLVNDRETISGVLDTAVVIPAGPPVLIPLLMRLDLFAAFDGPVRDLVALATSVAGADPDPATIKLVAVPTIDTPLGPMSYPTPITVVSRTLGGSRGLETDP